ncbi:hypothetical protein [Xylanimonas ulmi]|uniref:Uncharacterized protein n=1 Tax=Xylanimonas ulmi TaxID=228973 RepID=A0A4V2EXZ4_9MICO|nr:hypothetical protein [Xylanibacterium ulmi]RZS61200.1 hypothetical protein EV386_1491 [Xylanibacterium ulmi]
MPTTACTTAQSLDVDMSADVACECMLVGLEVDAHSPDACRRPARWVIRSTCCTQTILLCDDCLTAARKTVADIVSRQATNEYRCWTCDGPFAAGTVRRL